VPSIEAAAILELKPALIVCPRGFDGCFGRITTRQHLGTCAHGQLSNLRCKSVEPIALAAGTPPRTLQEFLGLYRWDESARRNRLQQRIARDHANIQSVGVLDGTSFAKKGDKTVSMQREHCGLWGNKRTVW